MISTERLFLRPIELNDQQPFFNYRSDAEVNKYQGWVPKNLKDAEAFILKKPKAFNMPETWFQLVVIEKNANKIIGDIGIHFIDPENFQCEIGCTFNKAYHGKGYATESIKGVIDFLFGQLNKHRIMASVDPGNTSSIKLMERLGFRKEGHFKESLLINGKWVDDIIYAVLNREWK